MRLVGAKEFLRTVSPGTLFIQFWMNEKRCYELIEDYNNHLPLDKILEKYVSEYAIFGDNSGSLSFLQEDPEICEALGHEEEKYTIDGITYDCLFYYDLNIVGDAGPTETLYIVFDKESEWPESIPIQKGSMKDINESPIAGYLHPDDIARIRKWFLEECGPFQNEADKDNYHYKMLGIGLLETEEYYRNNPIVNYNLYGGLDK